MNEEEEELIKNRLNALNEMQKDGERMYKFEKWALKMTILCFIMTILLYALHQFVLSKPLFGVFFVVLSMVNWWSLDRAVKNIKATKELNNTLDELERRLLQLRKERNHHENTY